MSSENIQKPGEMETEVFRRSPGPPTPDEIEGEVVWAPLGRCGSDAHYHTKPDADGEEDDDHCHHLSTVPDERIYPLSREQAERREYAFCKTCKKRENGSSGRPPGEYERKPCPMPGCDAQVKFIPDHLAYECSQTGGRDGDGDDADAEQPLTCPDCGRDDFDTARGVDRHRVMVHSDDDADAGGDDEDETECPDCGRDGFAGTQGLEIHRAFAHGTDSSETTTCPECGRDDFDSEHGMRTHLARIHDERIQDLPDDERVACPACGQDDFASEKAMRVHHTKVHGYRVDANSTQCERCGGWFTPKSNTVGRFCSPVCARFAVTDQPRGEGGQFIAADATEGGG